jgi:predicted dehydrogenase
MKRREFVKKIAGAGLAVGFPTIIPATVLGKNGAVAPSERITFASIGLGTQGTSNTKVFFSDKRLQLVALCDVNATEGKQYYGYSNTAQWGLQNARKLFGMDIPCYNDFREVVARKDIDFIQSATPDHWHAIIGMACVAAGKDVYGEKPLTRTIREGKVLRDAVERSGRIWQTGSWQRSIPEFVRAAEIIRNGYLGRVHRVQIGLPSNFKAETLSPVPVPKGFDWEMWQGPAPRVEYYHPNKTFTRWRGIMNYCAGKIADWGAHHLDIAQWALGVDESGPVEIVPEFVEWPKDGFSDQPMKFSVTLYYKEGFEINISDMNLIGVEFFGTKGSMYVTRGKMSSSPIGIAETRILPTEDRLFPPRSDNHFTAFVDSIRDRRRAVTDINIAHRTNTGCLLSEIAYRLNRPIKWDPVKEEIVGDEQASRMCDRSYCAPWQLKA